jgi:RimJ/RimL family protein N-acetyltransferase
MTGEAAWSFLADGMSVDELHTRSYELADIPATAPAFLDPAIGGEAGLPPFDEDELRAFVTEQLPPLVVSGALVPFVIEDATGNLGGGSLQNFNPFRETIEVGYYLVPAARGRGAASRVVTAVAVELFARGIARLEALIRPENAASIRVVERVGFTREGRLRSALRHNEARSDALMYSLLPADL